MNAYSFDVENIDALQKTLEQFDEFEPTFAFVFSSIEHDLHKIVEIFNERNIVIFGATTAGEIFDDTVVEQSIAVMLLDMPKDYYEVFFEEVEEKKSLTDYAKLLALRAKELFAQPKIILSASGAGLLDGDAIILGMKEILGENAKVFGGIAGDDLLFTGTYVYTNAHVGSHAVLGLILDGSKVELDGMATSGWEPLGETKIVTKSKDNIVYEIDGKPAIDVFIKYYGLSDNLDEAVESIGTIGARYPILIQRKNQADIMRSPVYGRKEDKSLVFAGTIPQGAKIKFTVPPTFDIMENTVVKFKKVKERIPEADALLMFSCKARHIVFGFLLEDEVRGIRKFWDKPLVGFFTYGEFGNDENGALDFHNETCTLAILKEKS